MDKIKTEDVYKDFRNDSKMFDFSNYVSTILAKVSGTNQKNTVKLEKTSKM